MKKEHFSPSCDRLTSENERWSRLQQRAISHLSRKLDFVAAVWCLACLCSCMIWSKRKQLQKKKSSQRVVSSTRRWTFQKPNEMVFFCFLVERRRIEGAITHRWMDLELQLKKKKKIEEWKRSLNVQIIDWSFFRKSRLRPVSHHSASAFDNVAMNAVALHQQNHLLKSSFWIFVET